MLAFEAYLNLPPGRTDAIFLRACCYQPELQDLYVAVPLRAATSPGGFAVFRPSSSRMRTMPSKPGHDSLEA